MLFTSSWAVPSLAFNYVYWRVSVRAEYTYVSPLTRTSSPTVKHERRSSGRIGARSIVRSSGFTCYPIAVSYNTSFNCTTVAYRLKINRKIKWLYNARRSLWIVRVSYFYFFLCIYFDNNLRTISNVHECFVASVRAQIVKGDESNSFIVAKQRQRQLPFIKLPFKNSVLLLQVHKTS